MRIPLAPELYWLAAWGFSALLAVLNRPASAFGNLWLERLGSYVLPLILVPLSFWLIFAWWAPSGASKLGLWLRLSVAAMIGLNLCLFQLAAAIDYGDSRNSGTLGVWAIGFVVGVFAHGLCSGVLLVLQWRSSS